MSTVKEALGPRLSHTCIAFMISLIFCSYPLWFSVSWAWAVVFQNPPECGPQTLPILCLLSHSWILQLRNLQTLWRMLTELHHTQWTIVSTTLGATIWTRFWSTTTTRNIPLCGNSRMHLKGSYTTPWTLQRLAYSLSLWIGDWTVHLWTDCLTEIMASTMSLSQLWIS